MSYSTTLTPPLGTDPSRSPIGDQQDALTSKKEMPSLMNFFQGSAIATFLSK